MSKYNHKTIESKWQKRWEKDKIYETSDKSKRPKKYVLIEFPYPSGEGLHMGHLRPYVAGDVYSRFHRMNGFETMYPMGWDAFGLPAENFAIKKGIHPSITTKQNIANAKKQVQAWGIGFDWSREINTTDPSYFKWTQWIFLQFFKAGLAYEATGEINWCPKDKTGLANEEVIDGRCERCGTLVEKKKMRQWYLKITAYAEKLLEGLSAKGGSASGGKKLDWPEHVKLQQENWIGKSEGAEIDFKIAGEEKGNCIIIHGSPRKDRTKEPGYENEGSKHWILWIKKNLEAIGIKTYNPQMPAPWHPVYEEWKQEFEKLPINEHTTLIGHSAGGAFVTRWLAETKTKIAKLILVAPAKVPTNKPDAAPGRFDFLKAFYGFEIPGYVKDLARERIIFVSNDSPHILDSVKIFEKALDAKVIQVPNRGHFTFRDTKTKDFPELLEEVDKEKIKVFTTRPDTIFGATYMVLAPEHELIQNLKSKIQNWNEVEKYVEQAGKKSDMQRTAVEKEKTGVELKGVRAINPATKEEIPVWIADYVLAGYGTGAIMAVPAHDERDRQFAEKYKLPIVDRPLISIAEATKKFGKKKIQYKLRDWVFSRQRYWGEPIPLVHCEHCGVVPVPEKDLPVELPKVEKYEPTGTGESPLAGVKNWVNVNCPNCDGPAKRETNTMPQWAGSSWYYLRYADPHNNKKLADPKLLKQWLPVDVYFGGMEHTTLHLLYSRFWHLFLYDQGIVPTPEPYTKRVPHGIILGPDGEKMSKSRGNVVNPDEIVEKFGADALRMYELFLGPHEATIAWNTDGIIGISRFLEKVWRIANSDSKIDRHKLENTIHKTIKKIKEDIENSRFNTAVSALMILANEMHRYSVTNRQKEIFLKLLAPFAPYLTEELWQQLGHKKSIHLEEWPEYDRNLIKEEKVRIAVQVNGKLRATIEIEANADAIQASNLAEKDPNVKKYLEGGYTVVYVPGKVINFVLNGK